jgi:hypothetical protein
MVIASKDFAYPIYLLVEFQLAEFQLAEFHPHFLLCLILKCISPISVQYGLEIPLELLPD